MSDESTALVPIGRRCSALSRTGERCKKPPILGGTVCGSHGGGAPQVRRKAEATLLAARDSAAAFLQRLIAEADRSTCPKCGRLWAHEKSVLALRAAIEVLNRTGLREMPEQKQRRPGLKGHTDEQLLDLHDQITAAFKEALAKKREQAAAAQPVLDAVVVESGR